ncbi:2-hydroxyacid dehydrogenase [Varunaivibrio sulfuroxidans]|uniref:Glyoxylate/hydroxypyruvate reductase A n=1 Tax=Varunaivibrio sulfuroxidans TaxID=1773489 RepID=A0A4R3JGJ2_9PROT|nr:glyoxylate/hydroxypyruvate reductase A [Varunaivibrio sulfuroxidans]TCS65042.1 glyoxylate/hydroxypyruvate reductase A [Varunaivibrio sulfuroxidans]WES29670.1 glyoxylate/hydroxypyruvate reductase A [Varunaivibrio sulfuroxidans]
MNLLYISPEKPDIWRDEIARQMPDADFRVWPDEIGDPAEIDVILCWRPPADALRGYPNAKLIYNLGAGIDALMSDPTAPRDIPVVRLIDPLLTAGMTEYMVYWTLHFHRNFQRYAAQQKDHVWRSLPAASTAGRRVGVLGLGELGAAAARALVRLGFGAVAGWSRTPKTIDGVESFSGAGDLKNFLGRTEILLCLLPLTDETRGIVNRDTLAALPRGACLINAARGAHVVDEDLLAALDGGHIAGAALDVFNAEPLPADHPYWRHPRVYVTPHNASLSIPEAAVGEIKSNLARLSAGEPLLGRVDFDRGY